MGRLVASPDGIDPTFEPVPGVDPEMLAKFRATDLLACTRYLAGGISLHASAVAWPGAALALVGESGAGKSTTAMGLVERRGAAFLADDIVSLRLAPDSNPLAEPVEDSFWLEGRACSWFGVPERAEAKQPCRPRKRATEAVPLTAVVHLAFDDSEEGVRLDALSGHDRFLVWTRAHVSFAFQRPERVLDDFNKRASLSEAVPLFDLRRPRRPELLDDVLDLLSRRFAPCEGG
jgi:ABC-type dipeptide/oligopeptide/nickel transport system ATPase component